jgi:hypothetical protein
MQNVTISEFKTRFSHLLNLVKQGEEIRDFPDMSLNLGQQR